MMTSEQQREFNIDDALHDENAFNKLLNTLYKAPTLLPQEVEHSLETQLVEVLKSDTCTNSNNAADEEYSPSLFGNMPLIFNFFNYITNFSAFEERQIAQGRAHTLLAALYLGERGTYDEIKMVPASKRQSAYQHLEAAINFGNARALSIRAYTYLFPRDEQFRQVEKAKSLYKRAIAYGDSEATYMLAGLFDSGARIPQVCESDIELLEQAIQLDNPYALVDRADIYEATKDYVSTYKMCRKMMNYMRKHCTDLNEPTENCHQTPKQILKKFIDNHFSKDYLTNRQIDSKEVLLECEYHQLLAQFPGEPEKLKAIAQANANFLLCTIARDDLLTTTEKCEYINFLWPGYLANGFENIDKISNIAVLLAITCLYTEISQLPLSDALWESTDGLYKNADAFINMANDRLWKILPILEPAIAINLIANHFEYAEWHEMFTTHLHFLDEKLWPSNSELQSSNDIEDAIIGITQCDILAELANLYLLITERSDSILPGCDNYQYINACNLAKVALNAIANQDSNRVQITGQNVDVLRQKLENALQNPQYSYNTALRKIAFY